MLLLCSKVIEVRFLKWSSIILHKDGQYEEIF
ncbi:hypothetical protein N784_07900 [Pontibacillus litoralis JSM 072002]|uniref:Uncharacterized protein n=1 Tax=Pontibacillus litoralis JSM 072002 TaxID=1385512 RepID=A0A0A5GBV9_9BACI|nr:hypothetical protein N784_07900 [Pontibacillus litoralis JSM 072002]